MMSFRYHVVSLVSVLFALAVGVALGGGPLQGDGDSALAGQAASDRHAKAQLENEVAGLRSDSAFTDDFASTVAPGLVGDSLRGRVVTMLALPDADPADVSGLRRLVGLAGGSVGGTFRVQAKLLDVGNKQLVDELGNQLQDRASGVRVPAAAGPYDRVGALLGRAVGASRLRGARVDRVATGVLAGLDAAGMLSAQARPTRRGGLVLVVAGPGQGTGASRRGAATIVTSLVAALDRSSRGVVVAGPVASARTGGPVAAVRADASVAHNVSTVDSLGQAAGRVVAVMALAGQAAGRSGQYGAVDAADGAMPGARTSTD